MKRKISRGISVEDAAAQTGIPVDEVFEYVFNGMKEVDTLNFQLRLIGQGAIKNALTKLSELAAGSERLASETNGPSSVSFASVDLEAAKALAKFGIDALKLARAGNAPRDDEIKKDLFDPTQDPWKLKKIE